MRFSNVFFGIIIGVVRSSRGQIIKRDQDDSTCDALDVLLGPRSFHFS